MEGRVEGRRETVARLLRMKFRDAVSAEVLARIAAAEPETLEGWEERILLATRIEDVLR